MNILLATKNINKHREISRILKDTGNFHQAIYKEDLLDVVEDKNTILENAQKKAHEIYDHYQVPVISDDSGLFVNSLDGMPGLHSKRYAGENATDLQNIDKLLANLIEEEDRSAYFQTACQYFEDRLHSLLHTFLNEGQASHQVNLQINQNRQKLQEPDNDHKFHVLFFEHFLKLYFYPPQHLINLLCR
jgi:non-canonical purine NTP pyrophosphatase (RdgB/HAM1 family)